MVARNTSARTRSDAIRSRSALNRRGRAPARGRSRRLLRPGARERGRRRGRDRLPTLPLTVGCVARLLLPGRGRTHRSSAAHRCRRARAPVRRLLRAVGRAGADVGAGGPTHPQSPGFIERLVAGDPAIVALHGALAAVVQELIDDGTVPASDVTATVLLWVTVFDERSSTTSHPITAGRPPGSSTTSHRPCGVLCGSATPPTRDAEVDERAELGAWPRRPTSTSGSTPCVPSPG